MSHDTEILSWMVEYACSKDYRSIIAACHELLGEEDIENFTPVTMIYQLLRVLTLVPESSGFHSDEMNRFEHLIQAATTIFNIEERMKMLPGKSDTNTGANELLQECYYQAILCHSTKQDVEGSCTSSSQNLTETKYVAEVLAGIITLAEGIKSNRIPKSLMNAHKLSEFEEQLAKYVEDTKSLLPSPTLVEVAQKRHPPQMPTDIKPYTLDELYFAWDGHDIEWQLMRDLTHPDIKAFYRNNPNMPKEIRDYVKQLPDNRAKLQHIKTGSPAVTAPNFSTSHLSSSPSPSVSSKSPAVTPFSSYSKTPAPTHKRSKVPFSQPLTQQPTQDEVEDEEVNDAEEEKETEKESKKEKQKEKEKEERAKDDGWKRKKPDTSRDDAGRTLRMKSRRLHAMGEDPLDEALEYGNEIKKVLDKNSKKKEKVDNEESEEEETTTKKPQAKGGKKYTKAKKQVEEEEEEEEEEDGDGEEEKKDSEEEEEEEEEIKVVWTKPAKKYTTTTTTRQNGTTTTKKQTTQAKKKKIEAVDDNDEIEEVSEEEKDDEEGEESDYEGKTTGDNNSSSDDDFVKPTSHRLRSPAKIPKPKLQRRKFSPTEEQYVRKGVERFGVGKWKEILMSYNFDNRDPVDLKDKWRNMERAKAKKQ